jgi:hypothetical protein
MSDKLVRLTYEIELQQGQKLYLPEALIAHVGPGRWRVTVQPVRQRPTRSHAAFLNGYAPEDEGLYDDHPAR